MNTTTPTTQLLNNETASDSFTEVIPVQDEIQESIYIRNLFEDEGAFGEADCPGL